MHLLTYAMWCCKTLLLGHNSLINDQIKHRRGKGRERGTFTKAAALLAAAWRSCSDEDSLGAGGGATGGVGATGAGSGLAPALPSLPTPSLSRPWSMQ